MPIGGGGGGDQAGWGRRVGGGRPKYVERPRTIIAGGGGGPGGQILHRETKRVKLNGTRIVGGEPTDIKKVVSNVRSYENVVEIERSEENLGTYRGDRQSGTVSNDDRGRMGGMGGGGAR
jgi:hypothetical protein